VIVAAAVRSITGRVGRDNCIDRTFLLAMTREKLAAAARPAKVAARCAVWEGTGRLYTTPG
jgi:hypothetical protein